ncbi:alpha/beta fold hydrolase [Streptacidiphilus jiangxiensis]|uniref:Lysophospholipase, alpha-beta hydrolase superfamily n=1 Tax=Streptacidiphilus jiangxiensis TaxID=235985 RepID=A0A1H7VN47_STRJI|nr:alpha/beta fold hydrolase [Streptacidiphilus jiangxiensis]SEM10265.1 Lysophospholipase, alpha-beta hydrolase superfamily [Streptacidiphilus jiangxiensis]
MTGTTTDLTRTTEVVIGTHEQSDGYLSHYRLWGSPAGGDVVVILHGGVSHSGWQAPLAKAVVETSDLSFVALDRRGSGLNQESRGHLPSEAREVEDVVSFLRSLAATYRRVHLAGWCFGGQIASIIAAELAGQGVISSLIMVAPGFVFTERYGDVLRLSMQAVAEVVEELGVNPARDLAFVPVPLQPIDFTTDEAWLRFATDDELKLRRVTQSTVDVWNQLADRSRAVLSDLGDIPVLAVFGAEDRLVDNEKVAAMLQEQVTGIPPVIHFLDAPHAVQFAMPETLAALVTGFVAGI